MSRSRQLEIAFQSTRVHCDAISRDADGTWYLIHCKPLKGKYRSLDALQVRDEFLRVNSDTELKAFLEKTGCFNQSDFAVGDLQSWQSLFKALMTTPPPEWSETLQASEKSLVEAALAHRNLSMHLPLDGVRSLPTMLVFNTLEAIMASILTDHLHGVRYAICGREDCAKLFPVKTKRARLFCTQYCGHLVSLRKSRSRNLTDKGSRKSSKKQDGTPLASA